MLVEGKTLAAILAFDQKHIHVCHVSTREELEIIKVNTSSDIFLTLSLYAHPTSAHLCKQIHHTLLHIYTKVKIACGHSSRMV